MVCLVPSSSVSGRTSKSRGEDTNHFFIDDTCSLRPTLAAGDDSKAPDQAMYKYGYQHETANRHFSSYSVKVPSSKQMARRHTYIASIKDN